MALHLLLPIFSIVRYGRMAVISASVLSGLNSKFIIAMDKKRQISSSSCFLQNIKSGINAKSTATSKPANPPSNKKKHFSATKFLPSLP